MSGGMVGGSATTSPSLTCADVEQFIGRLPRLDGGDTPATVLTSIGALEQLKAAAAAAQARLTVQLDEQRRAAETARGVPARERCRGLGSEVALARRESPVRGSRHLGLARALVHEMPHALAALSVGETSEWAVTLLCQETAALTAEQRGVVDAELGGKLKTLSDRQVAAAARAAAARLDPAAMVARIAVAEADRRVTLRPAPDTMTRLTAVLPVAQGVAVYAALCAAANRARAAGDRRPGDDSAAGVPPRSRGQLMADTLVERATGQVTADAVPVTVNLVMTDAALLAGAPTPARVAGYGPVPAALARKLASTGNTQTRAWVRRVYTSPDRASLVALDSSRRVFPAGLADLIELRDQTCRTPFCDAPVRHTDHVTPVVEGGPTSYANGAGLCEACNYTKALPGWSARGSTDPSGRHTVHLTTPTGLGYDSTAPPALGHCAEPDPPEGPSPALVQVA